ncbi:MAG: flavin reductase [Nitrospinota bacterium]|nr:MAG: flavin reductase [Nitrospinota bacterium]
MVMTQTEFRHLMGYFATGVSVVTTRRGDELRGMTANAITSLSLDPLLLLVCVERRGSTHLLLEEGRVFAVNFLREDQEHLSRAMAQSEESATRRLLNIPYCLGESGAPVLKDCLAFLDCRVVEMYPGGDHTIFVGAVEAGGVVREGRPLIFYQGQYTRLAE